MFNIFHVKLHVCDLRWASLLKVIEGSSEILKIFQMRVILILIVKKTVSKIIHVLINRYAINY